MADWVTGKVTKVQFWTDALFSLTLHAPVHPFTAGQFAKLGLDIDGERVQRAYSYVNAPDNPDLEFYLVTVPDGKLSPRLAALKPGDCVGVWGGGPAGTLIRRAALAKGATSWTVEPHAGRRARADGFEIPPDEGCDIAVVAVGDAVAYQQAVKSLRPRGCLVLFSGLSPATASQPLDFNAMHYLEQRVAGAYGCTFEHSEEAIRLLDRGDVQVSDMISHRLPLDELDHALGIVERREGMKVLLYP